LIFELKDKYAPIGGRTIGMGALDAKRQIGARVRKEEFAAQVNGIELGGFIAELGGASCAPIDSELPGVAVVIWKVQAISSSIRFGSVWCLIVVVVNDNSLLRSYC